jgi:drug/metabolite transporter (DMT)-like permease
MPVWFYVFLGIVVNCLWGTAFLVPYYFTDINPVAIAIGRYLVYGLVSLFLAFFTIKKLRKLSYEQWRCAFLFAFLGNVGYYLCITLSVHYGGITTTALIDGAMPLTMILAGYFFDKNSDKSFGFQTLLLPFSMVLVGIFLLNQSYAVGGEYTEVNYFWYLGLFFAVAALLLWTWYGFSNAAFLKKNAGISSSTWSIAIGVGCFFQALIGAAVFFFMSEDVFVNAVDVDSSIVRLVLGCLFLGVIVSWLATVWWNQVSRYIPMMIIGPLFVFETLSSLVYGYLVDQRLPEISEMMAILLIVGGVVLSMLVMSSGLKKPSLTLQESEA